MAKIATKPYPILSIDALSHSIKIGALHVTECNWSTNVIFFQT